MEHDEQGIQVAQGGIDGQQDATKTQAADPEGIDGLGGNEKDTFPVGDGTAMRHLADNMCVAYRKQAVRRHDLTQEGKLVVKIEPILALGEELQSDQQQ